MSSATCHFIIGAALALPAIKSRDLTAILPGWQIPVLTGVLATIPDFDLVGRRLFGIPYNSLLSHRGLFHSPFFLILFSGLLAGIVTRRHTRKAFAWLWLVLAGCMVTHPLLDALTDGGRGVMLLLPFRRTRFFFPWRPLHTPPGGIESVLSRAWLIRGSEVPFCVAFVLIGIIGFRSRRRHLAGELRK